MNNLPKISWILAISTLVGWINWFNESQALEYNIDKTKKVVDETINKSDIIESFKVYQDSIQTLSDFNNWEWKFKNAWDLFTIEEFLQYQKIVDESEKNFLISIAKNNIKINEKPQYLYITNYQSLNEDLFSITIESKKSIYNILISKSWFLEIYKQKN